MLSIALCIVHNRTNLGNRQQITALAGLLTTHYEPAPDATATARDWQWYSLTDLAVEHVVTVYQVLPAGVARPNNMNTLYGYNVIYGGGNADKTGEHPRFFNWALKRGVDNGADIAGYLRFPALFGANDLNTAIGRLTSTRVLITRTWGWLLSPILLRTLRAAGEETLNETMLFDDAITDLRQRLTLRGLESE
jgi:hypothetical protein